MSPRSALLARGAGHVGGPHPPGAAVLLVLALQVCLPVLMHAADLVHEQVVELLVHEGEEVVAVYIDLELLLPGCCGDGAHVQHLPAPLLGNRDHGVLRHVPVCLIEGGGGGGGLPHQHRFQAQLPLDGGAQLQQALMHLEEHVQGPGLTLQREERVVVVPYAPVHHQHSGAVLTQHGLNGLFQVVLVVRVLHRHVADQPQWHLPKPLGCLDLVAQMEIMVLHYLRERHGLVTPA
mmetsp:Transcript_14934/g.32363  ORF Transcript_14934/g.32363 Transcript_14934/m.32363 type:complete len:235 (-) Transcript_14934:700-1404(-)